MTGKCGIQKVEMEQIPRSPQEVPPSVPAEFQKPRVAIVRPSQEVGTPLARRSLRPRPTLGPSTVSTRSAVSLSGAPDSQKPVTTTRPTSAELRRSEASLRTPYRDPKVDCPSRLAPVGPRACLR